MVRRSSLRAPHLDYRDGAFLITVNAYRRRCVFGRVSGGLFIPNDLGITVLEAWEDVVGGDPSIDVQIVQGMPNHLHSVLILRESKRTLGTLVGSVKSCATRRARQRHQWGPQKLWHRSFHDAHLETDDDIVAAVQYVRDNPRNWSR